MAKNQIKYTFLRILTGSDLSKRRIPYMSAVSPNAGPTIWLTACMHGDEVGGTVVIHELFKKLKRKLLCGSVHAFPLMNPFGFETVSRNITISEEDLNRAFPGNPKGSLAQRIADKIFSFIIETKPDLVLDLHNDWISSIPYIILDPGVNSADIEAKNQEYAYNSGLVRIRDTDHIHSSLSYNLTLRDIPALTLELGESLRVNEKNISYGYSSVWNILGALHMVDTGNAYFRYPLPVQLPDQVFKYNALPLSSTSGIIRFDKRQGEAVYKGEKLARIYNPFGKLVETIAAANQGIILGLTDYAISYPGAPVMAFGLCE